MKLVIEIVLGIPVVAGLLAIAFAGVVHAYRFAKSAVSEKSEVPQKSVLPEK